MAGRAAFPRATIASETARSGSRGGYVLVCTEHALGQSVAIEQRGPGAAVDTRVGGRQVRGQRCAPLREVERRAEGAVHVFEGERCDADVGREYGDVASERLQWGQPEPLAVGRDEDRVRRVDHQRNLLGRPLLVLQELDTGVLRERTGSVEALLRAG